MVVPRFVQWALKDEPICIYGTGQQSRCFCYVQDVVDAVIGLMQCEEAVGQIFNVGSSEEVSIKQLADKVVALTASRSVQEFVPYEVAYGRPIEDMMRRVPCTERIRKTIGWKPKTDLERTLRCIIAEHREHMGTK